MKSLAVRRVALGMLFALTCAMSTAQASIVAVTGAGNLASSRTTPTTSGILADGDWVNDSLRVTWRISFNNVTNLWDYVYDVAVTAGSPGLSHYILELTHFNDGVDLSDYWEGIFDDDGLEVNLFGAHASNPGILGNIFGVKVDIDEHGGSELSFSTTHAPVWGDFYAKGGSNGFAYNSGYFSDVVAVDSSNQGGPADANVASFVPWVARPNGPPGPIGQDPVPEPATVMMWLGLAGAFAYGAKKRMSAAA